MKDFFRYFFGEGAQQEFVLFTPAHFAPIILMICLILLIGKKRSQIRTYKHEENLRYILGFALIITDMSYYWRLVGAPWLHPGPVENLPIGVCGWAVIFCSYMVIGKKQVLFDISYFWLLSGSLFALITPTPLTYTGPHPIQVLSVLDGAYAGICGHLLHDICPWNAPDNKISLYILWRAHCNGCHRLFR